MRSKAAETIRKMIILMAAAGAGAGPMAAKADSDTIKVSRTVPYADITVGSVAVRSECDWNKTMIDHLIDYSHGQIEATDEDLAKVHGRKLVLSIIGAQSTPGGQVGTNFGAGEKYGSISGKLMDNDQVIDSFQLTRKSGGGFMVFTACGTLDRIAKALASDTWHHLQQVANNPQTQALPTTDSEGSVAAPPRISWQPAPPASTAPPSNEPEAK